MYGHRKGKIAAVAALPSCRRGQAQSLDALVALISFALLMVFVLSIWADISKQAEQSVSISRLESTAIAVSDQLVQSPGVPYNWETSPLSVVSVGLASSPGVLSQAKLANLSALNYSSARTALGVDRNFYVVVSDTNWSSLYSLGNVSAQSNLSIGVTRMGTLNGQAVRIRVVVYE